MQLLEKYNVMVIKKVPFCLKAWGRSLACQNLTRPFIGSYVLLLRFCHLTVLSTLIHQDPINGLVSQQVVPVSPLITIFLCDRLEITQSIFASKGPQIQFVFHIIESDRRRSVFQPEDLSSKKMKERINLYVIWETKSKGK